MSESEFKNVIEYLIDSGAHMQMGIIYNTYERDRMREREKSGCSGSEKGRLKKTTNGLKTVWYTRGTRERENKNEIIIIERVNSKYLYRVSMVNERNASSYSIYLYVYLRVLKAK